MNSRYKDLQSSLGNVTFPVNKEEPVFHEPWEAQAFAMVIHLHQRGCFQWSEWAQTLSSTIRERERSGESHYYESWLAALEKIVASKNLVDGEELQFEQAAWVSAMHSTPHGEPIELAKEVARKKSASGNVVPTTSKT